MYVEGLRTELPFNFLMKSNPSLTRNVWSPQGEIPTSRVEEVHTTFDGRADLVLALRDKEGNGWLQVVDAKTKGCLSGFNSKSADDGHPLQIVLDEKSPHPQTDAEREIIETHRLQLALYCLALEENELKKPKENRRRIMPPARLVAASGRMIRMSDKEYTKAKDDLVELVSWMGYISAVQQGYSPPECSNPESCRVCNLFS